MIGSGYFSLRATPNFSFKQNIYEHPRPPGGWGVKVFCLYLLKQKVMYLISQMTSDQITVLVSLFFVTLLLWLLQPTPLGFLWRWYKMFWAVLLFTLMANFAKDEVKKWWNK